MPLFVLPMLYLDGRSVCVPSPVVIYHYCMHDGPCQCTRIVQLLNQEGVQSAMLRVAGLKSAAVAHLQLETIASAPASC